MKLNKKQLTIVKKLEMLIGSQLETRALGRRVILIDLPDGRYGFSKLQVNIERVVKHYALGTVQPCGVNSAALTLPH